MDEAIQYDTLLFLRKIRGNEIKVLAKAQYDTLLLADKFIIK